MIKTPGLPDSSELTELFFDDEIIRISPDAGVLQAFMNQTRVIFAAGGVVRNPSGSLLCIYRRGRWDLPKGKVEKASGKRKKKMAFLDWAKEEAVREVQEETGVKSLVTGPLMGTTWHLYVDPHVRKANGNKGKKAKYPPILKITWWFAMEASGKERLVPQAKEEITRADWIPPDRLPEIAGLSWPSLRALMNVYPSEIR